MQTYPNYTKTEKRIFQYIMDHQDEVVYDSAQTLADKTMSSPAAIIRFSKNLGFKGFTELKVELASDTNKVKSSSFNDIINNNDSLETILKKSLQAEIKAIEATYDMIDYQSITEAIHAIQKAKKIYLVGIGSSAISCQDFAQKLVRIQKDPIFYSDFHLQITSMTYMSKDDVVIGISYGGHTKEVIKAMKFAKELGATTIGITQLSKTPLQKYLDIKLYVPTIEQNLRLGALSSRNSTLATIDILYLGLISSDLESYKMKLRATRAAVQQVINQK